ncbi:hypothetical protein ACIA8G_14335 [Lentzea sp. NPDC051213]|uniref:hypothetical protein n=1 Tax=Lentzea sp. NPDC051213 TaxID=3364126 RepID=UPI0037A329DB
MATSGDIKIEATRPADLGEIARLIATTKDDGPVPPRLRRLVEIVGDDAGPDELGALAAKDAEFTALLREVLRESRKNNKRKTTIVFVAVLVTAGGAGWYALVPDRGTTQEPDDKKAASVSSQPSGTESSSPTGGSAPLVPTLVPSKSINLPTRTSGPSPTKTPGPGPQLATTMSQARGLPGTSVNFYGTGYNGCPGRRTVNVLWDGVVAESAVPIESDGRFGVRFTVPENASVGDHHLSGQCTDDAGLGAPSTYTVSPPLVVAASPAKLRAGQVLTVRGTNFDGCPDYGDRSVNVSISAMGLSTTAPIKADGTVDAQFTIPQGTSPNDYDVVGQCRDGGQWARGIFTVQP